MSRPPSATSLHGVKVVALEQAVAGPLCSRHLVDLGADVIKLERPGSGDFSRHYDSFVKGQSTHFVWLNRGKRSVELDLATDRGREVMWALLARADVFVHNLGPGAVERLGFGWEEVHSRHPSLVVCAISGFGSSGPYRDRKAYDAILQGESGVMAVTGTKQDIAKVGVSVADLSAAMYALAGILAALHERGRTSQGKLVEISMLDCLAEWMMPFVYQQAYTGQAPERAGARHSMIAPYGPFTARDGIMVNLGVQNAAQWRRFCESVIERPDLTEDARFATNQLRVQNRAELEAAIEGAVSTLSSSLLEERLAQSDIPFGRVNSVERLRDHPQLLAQGRWLEA